MSPSRTAARTDRQGAGPAHRGVGPADHPSLVARHRPELHGLRGLAIALVVLFHVFGDGRVSGGIDVFLAISGFLFTGMLAREAVRTGGRVDLGRYLGGSPAGCCPRPSSCWRRRGSPAGCCSRRPAGCSWAGRCARA